MSRFKSLASGIRLAESVSVGLKGLDRGYEKKYINFDYIVGTDEAGRGPLAGPVVAAACMIPPDVFLHNIHDSKKMSQTLRENAFSQLVSNDSIIKDVVEISHEIIDEINILQASLEAMTRACERVISQLVKNNEKKNIKVKVLVDGNRMPTRLQDIKFKNCEIEIDLVVKGDAKVFSIACASVLAKVHRDKVMEKLDAIYPEYDFKSNKGYPTLAHRTILRTIGPCSVHRKTYAPVRLAMGKQVTTGKKKRLKTD